MLLLYWTKPLQRREKLEVVFRYRYQSVWCFFFVSLPVASLSKTATNALSPCPTRKQEITLPVSYQVFLVHLACVSRLPALMKKIDLYNHRRYTILYQSLWCVSFLCQFAWFLISGLHKNPISIWNPIPKI